MVNENVVKIKSVKNLNYDNILFIKDVIHLLNKKFQNFFYNHQIYNNNFYNVVDLYENQTYLFLNSIYINHINLLNNQNHNDNHFLYIYNDL